MRNWLGGLVAALCVSCAAVKVKHLDSSAKRAPKPASCKVEPFVQAVPQRPHEIFGQLEYYAAGGDGSYTVAIAELSKKVCELGGDALLITESDKEKTYVKASVIAFK